MTSKNHRRIQTSNVRDTLDTFNLMEFSVSPKIVLVVASHDVLDEDENGKADAVLLGRIQRRSHGRGD